MENENKRKAAEKKRGRERYYEKVYIYTNAEYKILNKYFFRGLEVETGAGGGASRR